MRCVNCHNKGKKCKIVNTLDFRQRYYDLMISQITFHDISNFNRIFFLRRRNLLNSIMNFNFQKKMKIWQKPYEAVEQTRGKKGETKISRINFKIQQLLLQEQRQINKTLFGIFDVLCAQVNVCFFHWDLLIVSSIISSRLHRSSSISSWTPFCQKSWLIIAFANNRTPRRAAIAAALFRAAPLAVLAPRF